MPLVTRTLDHAQHLDQGKSDEALIRGLLQLGAGFNDWVITISYYAAMHYLLSKMITETTHPSSHAEFIERVNRIFGSTVYVHAKYLKDMSWSSRYHPHLAKKYRANKKYENAILALDKIKTLIGM